MLSDESTAAESVQHVGVQHVDTRSEKARAYTGRSDERLQVELRRDVLTPLITLPRLGLTLS